MLLMKKIKYFTLFLAITGFAFAGYVLFIEKPSFAASSPSIPAQNNTDNHIKAYYFHGNFRCVSCKKIEKYSREAIETYFDKQLKNGKLTFQTINTDKPENKHFIQDYQLVTKSLVIVEYKDGKQVKWQNLEKVWQHLNNKDVFFNYVKTETETYLKDM